MGEAAGAPPPPSTPSSSTGGGGGGGGGAASAASASASKSGLRRELHKASVQQELAEGAAHLLAARPQGSPPFELQGDTEVSLESSQVGVYLDL